MIGLTVTICSFFTNDGIIDIHSLWFHTLILDERRLHCSRQVTIPVFEVETDFEERPMEPAWTGYRAVPDLERLPASVYVQQFAGDVVRRVAC